MLCHVSRGTKKQKNFVWKTVFPRLWRACGCQRWTSVLPQLFKVVTVGHIQWLARSEQRYGVLISVFHTSDSLGKDFQACILKNPYLSCHLYGKPILAPHTAAKSTRRVYNVHPESPEFFWTPRSRSSTPGDIRSFDF